MVFLESFSDETSNGARAQRSFVISFNTTISQPGYVDKVINFKLLCPVHHSKSRGAHKQLKLCDPKSTIHTRLQCKCGLTIDMDVLPIKRDPTRGQARYMLDIKSKGEFP